MINGTSTAPLARTIEPGTQVSANRISEQTPTRLMCCASSTASPFAGRNNCKTRWSTRTSATAMTPVMASAITKSEEHTSELQSLMRRSYAVFCLKKKQTYRTTQIHPTPGSYIEDEPTDDTHTLMN